MAVWAPAPFVKCFPAGVRAAWRGVARGAYRVAAGFEFMPPDWHGEERGRVSSAISTNCSARSLALRTAGRCRHIDFAAAGDSEPSVANFIPVCKG